MDHSLAVAKRLWKLNETMSHAVQGHLGWTDYTESSHKTLFTGGETGKPLQIPCYKNPMNSLKRKNDMIFWGVTKMTLSPSSEGVQYATGEEWRAITNSSRKNEEAGSNRNDTQLWMYPASGGESKV